MPKGDLLRLNALVRTAYGIGGLLSPAAMERLQMAANTPERPDARLFVRGFSTHQIGVGVLGLASGRWPSLRRPAAIAAIAIDGADMLSAVVESVGRGELSRDLAGGLAFSATGVLTAWPGLGSLASR